MHTPGNIETKIKIEDLCRISNLAPTSLGVQFKKATGKSVVTYVNKIRIDKAKQLLKETDMSIISTESLRKKLNTLPKIIEPNTKCLKKAFRNPERFCIDI